MKIAIDITPIKGDLEGHKVRGVGSYINLLKNNLEKYDLINSYIFFTRGQNLSNNIDLIHYPYFEPFFLTLPFIKRFKQVITIHDLIPIIFPKKFPKGKKGTIKWIIQKKLAKKSDAIITDSISSKKDIIKIMNLTENKVHNVYLAASDNFRKIDEKKLVNKIRKKYNLPEKFVLYVGDATWNKNLQSLMSAIKSLNIPLVMIGKAFMNNDTKRNAWNIDLFQILEEIQKNSNFIKLGYVSEEELVAIYNLATLLCMPSFYEGFGLPVLEAMNCGCPVITTKKGSLEEVGGDAVYYVDPSDTDDIKNGIEKVYNDKNLLAELSRKGLLQAKKFSIEKTIKETIKIYEFLAK